MKILCLGLKLPPFFDKKNCLHFPVIQTIPFSFENKQIKEPFQNIETFTHVLFTSRSAVSYFADACISLGKSLDNLSSLQVIAVGKSTAEAVRLCLNKEALYPQEYSQEGVISLLKGLEKTDKVLFPKALENRDLIENFLKRENIYYVLVNLYRTVVIKYDQAPKFCDIQGIYFSSPSTVRGYKENFSIIPRGLKLYFSGHVTASAFKKVFKESFELNEKVYPLNDKIIFERFNEQLNKEI